ncbi:MAG: ComF family protein [Clostridia bacterium]|nr:ComF family protein [Clostridia bacterium]
MFTKFVDLIFPRACGLCGQKINQRYTCRKCLNILEYYQEKVVFYPKNGNYYDKLLCGFEYKSYIKNKMLQYKFENKRYLAKSFGDLLAYRLKQYNLCADLVVPVPIHYKRDLARGYNQSAYIAKFVGELIDIPVNKNILVKIKYNQKQSLLDVNSRKENVKNVYSVVKGNLVKDKKILLIDDIFTTGSTVNECSRVLKEAGAKEVIVATVLYGR